MFLMITQQLLKIFILDHDTLQEFSKNVHMNIHHSLFYTEPTSTLGQRLKYYWSFKKIDIGYLMIQQMYFSLKCYEVIIKQLMK